ncbi:UNVERIFIED_CONTAM: AAA-ATPase ASD, mitochondrial [Sesamum calycinum]|uniref:AAA-ATPase ASD, mitochondrial n=1 Tax=Sesamum calycinum TaxID=2727403 RepID=A0AAW2RAR4_9LAMI
MGGFWDNFSTLLLITTTSQRIMPEELWYHVNRFLQKLVNSINPYIEITFHEFPSESHMRSDAYAAIETYLGANLSQQAERLNANTASGSRSVALSIDDYEEITDVYNGRHRDIVVGSYLSHVLSEGKAIAKRNRRQRLYTNGKEYYRQIGKAWKRGYLLYGPPGTGKSTMIAAMANFLHFDVYDLELTAIKDNTELRKLMIEISKRAIVVIEDIDCSLDITGKRRANNTNEKDNDQKDVKDIMANTATDNERGNDDESKITLSGLLNFVDGYGQPAVGRESSCSRPIMLKDSTLPSLGEGEIDISPADVAENLMPKSPEMSAEECLGNLITALHQAKEEAASRKAKKLDAETEDKESEVKQQSGTASKEEVKTGFRKIMLRILAEKYNCFR